MKPFQFRLISILALVILVSVSYTKTYAQTLTVHNTSYQSSREQLQAATPVPTISPASQETDIPPDRVLPPVGTNAGLVLGAIVLVLIIIGGVLGTRRRANRQAKH